MFTGDECRMFYGDGGDRTVYPRTQVSASYVNFFPPLTYSNSKHYGPRSDVCVRDKMQFIISCM